METYPQARHHTYLPGIITPLVGTSPTRNSSSSSSGGGDGDGNNNMISRYSFSKQQQQQQRSQLQYQGEHRPSWVQEMAVLELSPDNGNDDSDDMNYHTAFQGSGNIVIFPGSIVPLRLLDHEWITYLQQQIHTITSTNTSTTTSSPSSFTTPVRFGILMPRPTNTNNDDDDDDDDYDDDDIQTHRNSNASSIPEQRQSWTRQAHGPNTLRRLSDQLIQELGPNFDYDDESDSDNDIRNLNSTMITDPEASVLPATAAARDESPPPLAPNESERVVHHRNDRISWTLHRSSRQAGNSTNEETLDQRTVPEPWARTTTTTTTTLNDDPHSEENINRAVRMFLETLGRSNTENNITGSPTHSRQLLRRNQRRQQQHPFMMNERQVQQNRRRRRSRHSLSSSNSSNNNNVPDRYIGRIGTIATVLYTHGNDNHNSHDIHGSSSTSTSSLVITAIGTSRFRIVGYRNDDEQNEYNSTNHRHRHYHSSASRRRRHGNLKHFLVEELKDVPMNVPNHCHYRRVPMSDGTINVPDLNDESTTTTSLQYFEQYIQHLSIVSPYPKYILQKMLARKIMAQISHYIQIVAPTLLCGFSLSSTMVQQQQNSETRDETTNETSSTRECSNDGDCLEKSSFDTLLRWKDPIAFSYWMATNLPFRYEEKIQLLEICSTIERLQYIFDKLRNEHLCAAKIYCVQCKSPLACSYDMFTVDGADGTTGNYVNEYGHVHQTITLRSIEDEGVWYQGRPQSQDSWFPGYCWTVMACAICGHHLGWKFTRSDSGSSSGSNSQRPATFYGVSAANISTFVPYEFRL